MRAKELLAQWNKQSPNEAIKSTVALHLPINDAARLRALAEMYPNHTLDRIISDLICSTLHEITDNAFPVTNKKSQQEAPISNQA